MKIQVKFLAILLLSKLAVANVTVESKIMEKISTTDQWRKISIRIKNNDSIDIKLSDKKVEYYISDSLPQVANLWLFQINNMDWTYHVQGTNNAIAKIDSTSPQKKTVVFTFNNSLILPKFGTLEIQFGMHRNNYSAINQSQDYSFINILEYIANPKIYFGSLMQPAYQSYNDSSILGQDIDKNNVRDDIDAFINAQSDNDTTKTLLRKMSITLDSILITKDTNETIRLNRKYLTQINCAIGWMGSSNDYADFSDISKSMFAKQINTYNRLKAYFDFRSRVSGMVFKLGNFTFNEFCLEEN